jgi:methylated-DNA-[protein]-cysteine S-methyltransferase
MAILGLEAVAVTHVVYEAEGWGVGELVVEEGRILWHELPWPRARGAGSLRAGASLDPSLTPTHPGQAGRRGRGPVLSAKRSRGDRGFATEVERLIQAYFAGEEVALGDVPVDLEYETDFLAACARALRNVPRGEVVTYGELAALAGAPGAARAAGSFCARNRLGLFVPCHRVVSAGGLGSYGSYGLRYKRRLLELEGAL